MGVFDLKFNCDNFDTELFIDEVEKRIAIWNHQIIPIVVKRSNREKIHFVNDVSIDGMQAITQPLFPSPCLVVHV